MTRHIRFAAVAGIFGAALMAGAPAAAQELLHGRVSFESGGVMVRGTEDDDWSFATVNTLVLPGDRFWVDKEGTAEIEFSAGNFLRFADESRVEVKSVPPNAVFEASTGSFYIQRVSRSSGDVILKTPAASVAVEKDSHVRIDIVNGGTTVTVRWGSARVLTEQGEPVTAVSGQRVFVDPGLLPSEPVPFDRNVFDGFDEWSRERAEFLATGQKTQPKNAGFTETTLGVQDLSHYGEWVTVDDGRYWRPTVVVNYVPYRYGHWGYTPAYGYAWIGNYPFSYVTSHYGRWSYHDYYGWIWSYSNVWAPAWVASVYHGGNFYWTPLNPYGSPVVFGAASFRVGDAFFSVYSTSYTSAFDLYRGPAPVFGATPFAVNNIIADEVNIWNIYAGGVHYGRSPLYSSRPAFDLGGNLLVRDYNPRRTIRGPEFSGGRAGSASARIARLEQTLGPVTNRASVSNSQRAIRTSSASSDTIRQAGVRRASISRDQQTQVTDSPASLRAPATRSLREANVASRAESASSRSAPGALDAPDSNARSTTARSIRSASSTASTDRTAGGRALDATSGSGAISGSVRTQSRSATSTRSAADSQRVVSGSPSSSRNANSAETSAGRRLQTINTLPSRSSGTQRTQVTQERSPRIVSVNPGNSSRTGSTRSRTTVTTPARTSSEATTSASSGRTSVRTQSPRISNSSSRSVPQASTSAVRTRTPVPSTSVRVPQIDAPRGSSSSSRATVSSPAGARSTAISGPSTSSRSSISTQSRVAVPSRSPSVSRQQAAPSPSRSSVRQPSRVQTQSRPSISQSRSIQAPSRPSPPSVSQSRSIQAPSPQSPPSVSQSRSIQAPSRPSATQQRSIQAPSRSRSAIGSSNSRSSLLPSSRSVQSPSSVGSSSRSAGRSLRSGSISRGRSRYAELINTAQHTHV